MATEAEKIEDGGFAFPTQAICTPAGDVMSSGDDGMTLREWFAGQALPAACTLAFGNISQATSMGFLPEEWAAKISYRVADEMLKAGKVGA